MPLRSLRNRVRDMLEPLRRTGVWDVAAAVRKGRLTSVRMPSHEVRWLITNAGDEIQAQQRTRGYYELDELEQLRRDVGERRHILDVGANIGNHAVFFAHHFAPESIVLVEPYPPAIEHLLVNLAVNFHPAYRLGFLGCALGRAEGSASLVPPSRFNIGLTRVAAGEDGPTRLLTGDGIVGDGPLDLVKIDVEGMELDVLGGLAGAIARFRPALYVEVADDNRAAFGTLLDGWNYDVLRETRSYAGVTNVTGMPR